MEAASIAATAEPVLVCQDGETNGSRLRRVFSAGSDGLYRFILVRVGGDREVADELLQQTCYVAARHRRLPADDDAIERWLRGVARNLIREHWRRAKKLSNRISLEDAALSRQLVDDMESRPLPPEVLIKDELVIQLQLAITSLPAAEQRLVFAFYFDGRSYAEIANDLGVTAKAVEARLYRARTRLRAVLRDGERTG